MDAISAANDSASLDHDVDVRVKTEDEVDEPMMDAEEPPANNDGPSPAVISNHHPLDVGARFEEDLASLLQSYQVNSSAAEPVNETSYDSGYEEAVAAIDRKREEISAKESTGQPTATDRIELKTLEANLTKIRKLRQKEQTNRAREVEDHLMFFSQDGADNNELELTPAPSRQEAMNDESLEHIDISDDGEEEEERTPQTNRRGRGRASKNVSRSKKTPVKADKSRVQKRGNTASKRGRGARQGPSMFNMGSLLRNNIVADAAANQGAGEQASFEGIRTKKDALAALIASIPTEQRDTKKGEKSAFGKAAKQFRWRGQGSMQVKDDGWRLKGMSTSLKNFQLLGAAWGCEREAGSEAPFGGILADTMGYGKVNHILLHSLLGRTNVRLRQFK